MTVGTHQEQSFYQKKDKILTFSKDSYQRQDKIQIHRQEIIHHYKNMHMRSTALTSPNIRRALKKINKNRTI